MNFIKYHSLKSKKILFCRRNFLSSVALFENLPLKTDPCAENDIKLNPLNFLNNQSKSRDLTLPETKTTHAHLLKTCVFFSDIFSANNLLDSYFKCGDVYYAFQLFEQIPLPNMVTWNLMISGCNKNFIFEDSWWVFCRMHFLGIDINQFTYGSILSACCALGDMVSGEQVYGIVVKNGFLFNGYVRAGMIDLFAKSFRFKDALRVFYDVRCDNVVCWNAIVSGAVKNNENWVALDIFGQMCRLGALKPNGFMFSSVLTACAALEMLDLGKGVQGWVIKCGVGEDVFVGSTIVDLYAKCGAMDEAMKQFKQMPVRNVVSWTTIISGFFQQGDSVSAVWAFGQMRKMGEDINNFTITSVLAACAHPSMIKEAMQIHCWTLKNGLYSDSAVNASLINMYSKIGAVNISEMVFAETQNMKQLSVWANMISAFAQNEISAKAINLFLKMIQEGMAPDKFITSSILSVIDCLTEGIQIHAYTIKAGHISDVSVGSSLFTMYSKCGNLDDSHKVFDRLEGKDNISWASMIAGFAEHGLAEKAILLFREMLIEKFMPDEMSLAAGLTACSALYFLKIGKEIHGFALRYYGFGEQTIINGALVNMYSKCGDLNSARTVLKLMPLNDQVSYSSLISGYSQSGYIEEALQLFHEMLLSDLNIDAFTISSILVAASFLNMLYVGTQLHARTIKMGVESESSVGSSLVMMYSKCGNIDDCGSVFRQIRNPDLISWTTMITSYAQHGKGSEALCVYEIMRKSEIKPDSVTFIGVLSACSHAGLVEQGYFHLNSMSKDYGIKPGYRHYACMVDVLGRAGRLKEAKMFIYDLPIEPNALVWGTLLAACRVHGDIELGKLAAEKILELGHSEAGAHISLSNIYADAGQWEDVLKIRASIKETGVKKEPGWSSV